VQDGHSDSTPSRVEDLPKRFAELVRRLRLEAALSQEDLAAKAGLHPTYISRLERGLRAPSLVVVAQLAEALSKSLSELMLELERGE
jgi:transcriptional regulator with XRE-family HTH domain